MKLSLNKSITFKTGSHRCFYKGERHVERICVESVLLLVYDGELAFVEDGKTVRVKKGEYYIQRSGLKQTGEVENDEPKYYYIHFDGEFFSSGEMSIRGRWNEETVLPLCNKLDALLKSNGTQMEKTLVFYRILSELLRFNTKQDNMLARTIMEEITRSYKEKINLSAIAKKLYISTNYLISVFKREYGLTPHKHVTNLKLEEAMRLLSDTTRGEEEIAFSVGYSDFSVFYKAFVKAYGHAPGVIRNKNGK